MTIKELAAKVEILEQRLKIAEENYEKLMSKKGPASQREMTIDDAERVINGDLKDIPHKKAAETLGLSYGQVYSARGGYTFKSIVKR